MQRPARNRSASLWQRVQVRAVLMPAQSRHMGGPSGGAAGQHVVLGAVWAGAVGVGGFGEAASADGSVGPAEADLGDLLVGAVAAVVPG